MKTKRIFAAAVSLAMVVQLMPMQVTAEEDTVISEENVQEDNISETAENAEGEQENTEALSDEALLEQVEELTENYVLPEVGVGFIELTPEQTEAVIRAIDEQKMQSGFEVNENYKASLYTCHSDYFRDQLNTTEKELYDSWVKICSDFMVSTQDITGDFPDYIEFDPDIISIERAQQIVTYAYYSYPEFFFLENGCTCGSVSESNVNYTYIAPLVNDNFKTGSVRNQIYNEVQNKTASWLAEINELSDDLEKEKYIAEKICNTVTYTNNYPLDQSLYGSLILENAVCNGYAMEMNYFCNAAGIDCITVISNGHAWNNVKLFGDWFVVDTTWMDQEHIPMIWYDWFNINTETMLKNDQGGSHIVKDTLYTDITLPSCIKEKPVIPEEEEIAVNTVNFPDSTFRSYISENFDKDGSGTLTQSEISAVTSINIAGTSKRLNTVADLTGIGYFTNLTSLDCSYNLLTSIDLSKNTSLKSFICTGNMYSLGAVSVSYSLVALTYGFDPAKASNWQGAEYDGTKKALRNFTSNTVTYDYDCGNGFTASFTLISNIIIHSHPEDITLIEGLDTAFSVSATGNNISYLWQRYNGTKWETISGETSSELKLENVTSDMNSYKYRCIVSTYSASTVSRTAVLTVTPAEKVTEEDISGLSTADKIKFVNSFIDRFIQDDSDCNVLTAAQLKAIEYVLEHDLAA